MSVEAADRTETNAMTDGVDARTSASVVADEESVRSPAEDAPAPSEATPALPPIPDIMALGVGPALRLRREQLGWPLPDVAAWLRIRLPYLEALESGQTSALPGNAYALGFLRTYASALGFSPEQAVTRFKREAKGVEKKPELVFPMPVPERSVPAGAIVLAGIVVIIGAYIGWYRMVGHEPTPLERVPSVATVMPGVTAGASPSPQIASVMPSAGPSPMPDARARPPSVALSAGVSTAPSAPLDAAPAGPAPVATTATSSLTAPDPTAAPMAPPATGSVADAVLPPGPAVPTLKATATSWIQVRDGSGKVVYDHVMQSGEEWAFPADGGPFKLTVGNAGGIALALGETMTAPLGRNGAVRRNIVVSADSIRDGTVMGTVPSPASAGQGSAVVPPAPADPAVSQAAPLGAPAPSVQPRAPKRAAPQEPSADDLNGMQLSGHGLAASSGE